MNAQTKDQSGWLAIFRPPNLLTVPGDVLAGFAIAWPHHSGGFADLLAALFAALLLYAAGLVINDLVDEPRDRMERPHRPIPSGRVSRTAARNVVGGLLAGALVLLAARSLSLLMMGVAVGGLIIAYNLRARRSKPGGVLVMGLCRAGSVGLGVVAGSPDALLTALSLAVAGWWMLYIASVSWLAVCEMARGPYGRERWMPLVVIVGGAYGMLATAGEVPPQQLFRAGLAFVFAALIAWQCALRLGMKDRRFYPPAIGWLISALIPLQAGVLVVLAQEPWMLLAALLLLFCWPLNRWLSKRFAAS